MRSQISDDRTHDISYYEPSGQIHPDAGTSQTSILTPDGAAVGVTSTINLE